MIYLLTDFQLGGLVYGATGFFIGGFLGFMAAAILCAGSDRRDEGNDR